MSTAAEFRQQMEEAIQSYRKAIERVKTFESKLSDARRSEAVAISDDDADEKKTVKLIAEAQGLAAVYSRRVEVAKGKVPDLFGTIVPLARSFAQELTNKCYRLARERSARHRQFFRLRIDLEALHRTYGSATFPVDFESNLDRLIDCCPDVIAGCFRGRSQQRVRFQSCPHRGEHRSAIETRRTIRLERFSLCQESLVATYSNNEHFRGSWLPAIRPA